MSIIHEALKKAQSNRPQNKNPLSVAISDPKIKSATTPPQQQPANNAHFFWYALAFMLVGITFFNLYEYIQQISTTPTTQPAISPAPPPILNQSAPPALAPQVIVQPAEPIAVPKPPQPKKGEIVLSGIVEMDGKKFALINNEFYETGETIEGTTITQITTDSIDILQKGKARTIKVLRPK